MLLIEVLYLEARGGSASRSVVGLWGLMSGLREMLDGLTRATGQPCQDSAQRGGCCCLVPVAGISRAGSNWYSRRGWVLIGVS